jgi:hypothetical protein
VISGIGKGVIGMLAATRHVEYQVDMRSLFDRAVVEDDWSQDKS